MKFLRWLNLIAVFTFLSACGTGGGGVALFPTETPLPTPHVNIIPAPDPNLAVQGYLDAFKADDYNTMYSLVSKVTQDTVTLEDFAKRNRDALNEMSASSFEYEILSALKNPYSAEVAYRVTYKTALV